VAAVMLIQMDPAPANVKAGFALALRNAIVA
jgi:hypothetical protein